MRKEISESNAESGDNLVDSAIFVFFIKFIYFSCESQNLKRDSSLVRNDGVGFLDCHEWTSSILAMTECVDCFGKSRFASQ
ncbi:hypothetical protein ACWIUD_09265 [Helicobacter sp. 23-1044]